MTNRKISYEQAFELLVALSRRSNCKLRDIASDVVFAGDI